VTLKRKIGYHDEEDMPDTARMNVDDLIQPE
jgi:hypothetical protein